LGIEVQQRHHSAGVAATDEVRTNWSLSRERTGLRRLLEKIAFARGVFRSAHAVMPFIHLPRLAFSKRVVAGSRWLCFHRLRDFVDPLLSTGFPLTLLASRELLKLLIGLEALILKRSLANMPS